jgi:hypothetical protein
MKNQHQKYQSKTTPISEFDWDFGNMLDNEVIACCFWEYARESKTLALASAMHWCNVRDLYLRGEYERNPKLKVEHDEIAASIERCAKAVRFDYDAFLETFWSSDLALVEIHNSITYYVRGDAPGWNELSSKYRSRLTKQVSESIVLRPLSQSLVGELEKLWIANREELEGVRAHPLYDDSEEAALHSESEPLPLTAEKSAEPPGSVVVAFAVDFARFTDGEICEEMESWLAANRPPQWKIPKRVFPDSKQRGRKRAGKFTEYHTALGRLGLMRLLHRHTPAEIRHELPQAWARYGRKQADFRREVREACKFFRRLFPFLPEKERPQSEPRKGIWFPEMLKTGNKVERELGMV